LALYRASICPASSTVHSKKGRKRNKRERGEEKILERTERGRGERNKERGREKKREEKRGSNKNREEE
jgi:hypothetical protein